MPALRLLSSPATVSGPIPAVRERPIEREDDLSLFFWLARELERLEVPPEAGHHAGTDAAERHARGMRHVTAALVARPAKTDHPV